MSYLKDTMSAFRQTHYVIIPTIDIKEVIGWSTPRYAS